MISSGAVSRTGVIHLVADEVQVPAGHAMDFGLITTELVLNALKYAYGDRDGIIEVVARLDGDRFVLTVSDHGVGMPADFSAATSKGGLGMRILRSLATRHGAELEAISNGEGTTVGVRMPRASLAAA